MEGGLTAGQNAEDEDFDAVGCQQPSLSAEWKMALARDRKAISAKIIDLNEIGRGPRFSVVSPPSLKVHSPQRDSRPELREYRVGSGMYMYIIKMVSSLASASAWGTFGGTFIINIKQPTVIVGNIRRFRA